jgi:sulfoxide reductase heme-binding subunit YedZ
VTTWYVTRAGGIVAFAILTASICVGLALSGRASLRHWPRFALEDVHRFLGLLAGFFVALHVGVLLFDDYLPFSPSELIVPGLSRFRPFPTALGVVALELLVALALTNHYRRRIPYRLWRGAHTLNFGVWALALVHGIGSGTDTTRAWALGLYAVSTATVVGLTAWRLLRNRSYAAWTLRLWPATAAVVAAELVVALSLGPLHHGA